MRNSATAIAAAIAALGLAAPASAATPLSVRDSFRIGTYRRPFTNDRRFRRLRVSCGRRGVRLVGP